MPSEKNYCRVCGFFFSESLPWGDDGCSPSFDICPCCGVEFGYEDATPVGVIRYRDKWLESGGEFYDADQRPSNWNLDSQLASIVKLQECTEQTDEPEPD